MRGKILLVDDEPEVRESLGQALELNGFQIEAVGSADEALSRISRDWPGALLTDVRMPVRDGLQLLDDVLEIDAEIPVILFTGHGDIAMALEATRSGAYDFIEKPADPEYLVEVAGRALEKRTLTLENRKLKKELDSLSDMEARLIGRAPEMVRLRATIASIADADVDVLVKGATGTGKELVARCLHDFGGRRNGRFVALNCAAMPEAIFESELFGAEAGAFTGATRQRVGRIEHASGGTLFLDEIESMPLNLQVKLLRVLQERTLERLGGNRSVALDIRVIAATKADLRELSTQGEFREDLYYRLHVARVELPALAERPADISLLFAHFVATAALRHARDRPDVEPGLVARLMAHDWPGNVRELKNHAERLVLGLPDEIGDGHGAAADGAASTLQGALEGFEREYLAAVLTRNKGRVGDTARALSLPRRTLYLRMKKLGLDKRAFK